MNSAFRKLVAPTDAEEFFRDYWERKYLHVRRKRHDYFAYALGAEDVDRYLQSGLTSSDFLRVLKDGGHCPAELWTRRGIVDTKSLLALRASGATVVVNHGEQVFPSLARICESLEHEMECRVQANLYITPEHSQGFPPHFDTHGVFVLQIQGRKQWLLYDTPVGSPSRAEAVEAKHYAEREPRAVIELEPGSLLYIPRGLVHCARTSESSSIHVTLGPMQPDWSTLIGALARHAHQEAAFRRLLPLGMSNDEEKAAFAEEFKREVSALLQRVDIPALMASSIQRNRKECSSKLADLFSVEQVSHDTVVRQRPGLQVQVERTDQWIVVKFDSQELSAPAFLGQAMDKLLGEAPFAVRDISGIPSEAGRLALARRFLKAGFLTVVSLNAATSQGDKVTETSGRTYARRRNESGPGESQGSVGNASA